MREDMDPRIDSMIAFLYGEMSSSEEKAFRRLLEKDAALRAELEELSEVRGALAGWEVEEHVPSFVLVDSRTERTARAGRSSGGAWARIAETFRSLAPGPAWALATAAVALVVLAAAGFRIERVSGGVAFRFGHSAPPASEMPLGEGRPIELARRPGLGESGTEERGEGGVVPVDAPYMTRGEFERYNSELMNTLVTLLNRYDERRDQETAGLLQSLYGKINERQTFDYERVNRRIDALGEGLMLESSRSQSIEDLLQQGRTSKDSSNPARAAERE